MPKPCPGQWANNWAMSPRTSRRARLRCWAWALAPAVSSIPEKASSATRCRCQSARPWIPPSRWQRTFPYPASSRMMSTVTPGAKWPSTEVEGLRNSLFPLVEYRPGFPSVGSQGGLGVGFGVGMGGKVYSGIHVSAGEFRSAFCPGGRGSSVQPHQGGTEPFRPRALRECQRKQSSAWVLRAF